MANFFSNLWEHIAPWKAIPNAIEATGDAFSAKGKDRHNSVLGAFQSQVSPLGAILGDDVSNFIYGTLPREINRALEPLASPLAPDFVKNKGGDTLALLAGAGVGLNSLGSSGITGTNTTMMKPPNVDWTRVLGQVGQALQQTGQAQPQQTQQPVTNSMQNPVGGQSGGVRLLQTLMQEAQGVQSLDELADRMAKYGAPPSFGNPETAQAPSQLAVNVQAPPPRGNPNDVGPPRIPQTRGEAQTSVNLGQALGGYYG